MSLKRLIPDMLAMRQRRARSLQEAGRRNSFMSQDALSGSSLRAQRLPSTLSAAPMRRLNAEILKLDEEGKGPVLGADEGVRA